MIYLIIGIALLMVLAFFIMWKKKLVVSEYTVKAPVNDMYPLYWTNQ